MGQSGAVVLGHKGKEVTKFDWQNRINCGDFFASLLLKKGSLGIKRFILFTLKLFNPIA